MRQRFEWKVAVIIGGNSGIGLASAKAFAREEARMLIGGRIDVRFVNAVSKRSLAKQGSG